MLFFFLSLNYFFLFCFILSSSSSLFLICSFICLDLFLLINKLTELGKYLSVAQRICNFELIKWLKCSLEYGKTESMCSNRIKQNIGIYILVYTDDIIWLKSPFISAVERRTPVFRFFFFLKKTTKGIYVLRYLYKIQLQHIIILLNLQWIRVICFNVIYICKNTRYLFKFSLY